MSSHQQSFTLTGACEDVDVAQRDAVQFTRTREVQEEVDLSLVHDHHHEVVARLQAVLRDLRLELLVDLREVLQEHAQLVLESLSPSLLGHLAEEAAGEELALVVLVERKFTVNKKLERVGK